MMDTQTAVDIAARVEIIWDYFDPMWLGKCWAPLDPHVKT